MLLDNGCADGWWVASAAPEILSRVPQQVADDGDEYQGGDESPHVAPKKFKRLDK